MKILFKNIKGLLQTLDNSIEYLDGHQMKKLSKINNAFLLIEDDQIIDYGIMNDSPSVDVDKVIEDFGESMKSLLRDNVLKVREDKRTLRMSNIGRKERFLWYVHLHYYLLY